MNSNPWDGMSPPPSGGHTARLVSAGQKWPLFWAVSAYSPAVLMLQHGEIRIPTLKSFQGIEISDSQDSAGNQFLAISLKTEALVDIFHAFCLDLMEEIEECGDEQEVVNLIVVLINRWHRLFQGLRGEMTFEEQLGLFGELSILRILISEMGAANALASWVGPLGEAQDFQNLSMRIEVKSVPHNKEQVVKISSEFQLDAAELDTIHLATVHIRQDDIDGENLLGLILKIRKELESSEVKSQLEFERKLSIAGASSPEKLEAIGWIVDEVRTYRVHDDFPCLAHSELPVAIQGVRYRLNLNELENWRVDSERVLKGFGGDGNG
jgi:hypothetical protein